MTATACHGCGAASPDRAQSGGGWRMDLPPLLPRDPAAISLCPACFEAHVRERIPEFVAAVTPATAAAAAARAQHYATSGQPIEGVDYEFEGGQFVLAAWYLLTRGGCCENGCRNCPYVP